ncbi:MAG TPA: carboxypeptidase-like regulatory domain-containing protein, partial [Bryobacteraceae bacterium]|nr:carboxypeptidase-like regulatory domain-containing protein [Bryobacteraceae bacterium]
MRRHALAYFCLLACFAARSLWGQAATATITGTITDTTGAVVPGATIDAKNTGTGITRSTESDNQGRYSLADLAIGAYDVQASKMGFRTLVKKNITLTVGAAPVADFQLPVGSATETVNVEADVSQVETESSTVSSLVG